MHGDVGEIESYDGSIAPDAVVEVDDENDESEGNLGNGAGSEPDLHGLITIIGSDHIDDSSGHTQEIQTVFEDLRYGPERQLPNGRASSKMAMQHYVVVVDG